MRDAANESPEIAEYLADLAPLIALVCYLSWQWLFDVTAANLWPLAMILYAIPCGIIWLIIFLVETRSRRVSRRRPA